MGKKTSTQNSTQSATPYGPATAGINTGIADAATLYGQGGFGITPYSGSMVAGYDPFRTQADNGSSGIYNTATSNIGGATDFLKSVMDPNQNSAAWDQIKTNTIDSIMPGINSSFAGSGMTGSGLHAQNLSAGLSQGLAEVENQNWQQSQDRALTAAGMMPSMNNATMSANDWLRGVGTDRQDYKQSVIDSQVQQDQQGKTAQADNLERYMSLLSGVGGQFGTTNLNAKTTAKNGGLLGILGGALQGLGGVASAGGLGAIFSDRRLKENIKPVGRMNNGLTIYSYNYKAGGPTHVGVMAQDVEKVNPAAVTEVAGYKAVDYGAL